MSRMETAFLHENPRAWINVAMWSRSDCENSRGFDAAGALVGGFGPGNRRTNRSTASMASATAIGWRRKNAGSPTLAGEYLGADLAYDKLLDKIAEHKFVRVSTDLRNNILVYYKDRKPPTSPPTKKTGDEWAKVMEQRTQLEQMQPETAATR